MNKTILNIWHEIVHYFAIFVISILPILRWGWWIRSIGYGYNRKKRTNIKQNSSLFRLANIIFCIQISINLILCNSLIVKLTTLNNIISLMYYFETKFWFSTLTYVDNFCTKVVIIYVIAKLQAIIFITILTPFETTTKN